jgi:hypothetical protein
MCTLTSEKVWRIRSFIFRLPPLSPPGNSSFLWATSPPRLSVCHDGVIWFSRHFTFVSLYQFFFLLSLVSPHVFSSVCVLTKRKENLLPFCIHGERPSYEYPASVFFLVRSWEKTESARLHVRCLVWMSTTSITLALIFRVYQGINRRGSLQAEDGTTAV